LTGERFFDSSDAVGVPGEIQHVSSNANADKQERAGKARSSNLPLATEEPINLLLHRPLAGLLVKVLAVLSVTPNQVTVASGVIGFTAAVFMTIAGRYPLAWAAAAGVLMLLSVVLDCADGQLARLRGEASLVGRALDGTIDIIPIASVFVGSGLYLMQRGIPTYYVLPVGFLAGYSWRLHASGYDRAKQLFIANTRAGTRSNALPTLAEIDAQREELLAEGRRGLAFVMTVFRLYTIGQHKGRHANVYGLARPPMKDDRKRALYRELFAPYMRWWSWNGIGTHHFLTYTAALLTPIWPTAMLVVWWIILIPMNVLYAITRVWGRRLEAQLATRLGETAG